MTQQLNEFPIPKLYMANGVMLGPDANDLITARAFGGIYQAPNEEIAQLMAEKDVEIPEGWLADVQVREFPLMRVGDYIGALQDAYALFAQ